MWRRLLLVFIFDSAIAIQLYRVGGSDKSASLISSPLAEVLSEHTHNETSLTNVAEVDHINMVAPLELVPEMKESRYCMEEGQYLLTDQYGYYRPAYPNSPTFGGRCSFDDFEEEAVIGRGAFGQVFSAVHKGTGIRVAIKEIIRPVEFRLIRKEECIQHSLRHPSIVRHYCTISEDNYIAFVMELVEGTTLFKARRRTNNLPIVSIAAQIVLMLEYLHDRNVLYRDLKPENIMYIPRQGTVKLIDFGLAQRLAGPNESTEGRSGTPPFMAPEIFTSPSYSFPVDWYSFGMVVYELISGHNPFDNIDNTALLHSHIAQGFDCTLPDKPGCHLIGHLTDLDPHSRWGHSFSSRKKIRYHPWFGGIPWKDFEAGDFSVKIPNYRGPRRDAGRLRRSENDEGKNPLRFTMLSSHQSYPLVKVMPDDDSTTGTYVAPDSFQEPTNINGDGAFYWPPIKTRCLCLKKSSSCSSYAASCEII